MLAGFEIVVLFGVLVIGGLGHVLRDVVVAFACHSGNDDDCRIGKCLCAVHQFLAVVFGGRFGQVPVLGRDGYGCAVLCIALIEIHQILVDFKAGAPKAVDQADYREESVHAAGACAAVNGIGGSPSEEVELVSICHGKHGVVILQKNEAFLCNLQSSSGCFLCGGVCDLAAACGQSDQGIHGTEADHVDDDRDAGDGTDPCFLADQGLQLLFPAPDCDGNEDGQDQHNGHGDEVGLKSLQYADQVFHFERYHCVPPFQV